MTASRRRWAVDKVGQLDDIEYDLMDQWREDNHELRRRKSGDRTHLRTCLPAFVVCLLLAALLFILAFGPSTSWGLSTALPWQRDTSCDKVYEGYTCAPNISHIWGQYSPYFRVPAQQTLVVPPQCHITFVQLLSRHGARDPTLHKSEVYSETISKIKTRISASDLQGPFAFLKDYEYRLGADLLTDFGRQELFNEGLEFFHRYQDLARATAPFIRASGQDRVIESAEKFGAGYHEAKGASLRSSDSTEYPYDVLVISESPGMNNTLNHGNCPAFESSNLGGEAQSTFAKTFLPEIQSRLNAALPSAGISLQDIIVLMDLCPYETVASPKGLVSPFCSIFAENDWENYDYFQTLGKYYGSGAGNPLGPTQGVGFVNELIARLTQSPVRDSTSVNHTLDSDPSTFPLQRILYADFSHDNLMMSVFAALGLYKDTPALDKHKFMSAQELKDFSAAKTVPFAGRALIEKYACGRVDKVRIIMNGKALPLDFCGGDGNGMCTLEAFINALEFAKEGGRWNECFQDQIAVEKTKD